MTNTRRGLWKSFVIELSEHLRKKEVEKLKWIFDLPDGASENEGALETIRRLETNKHIQEDNISTLFGAIKEIGRSDLIKKLQIYQDNYKEACVNQPDEETMNNKRPRSSYDEFEYKQASSNEQRSESFFANPSTKQPSQSQEGDYFESDTGRYKMDTEPRGFCLIINNMFRKEPTYTSDGKVLTYRKGSEKDKTSLTEIFSWLKFNVKSYDNVRRNYMETILEMYANDSKNDTYDCFVCCILSHGYEKGIYCNDGELMDFGTIRSFFTGSKGSKSLLEKPKLFIIQACQGTNLAEGILVKDSPVMPTDCTPIQDENGESIEEMDIDHPDNSQPLQSQKREPHYISSEADFSFFVATTPGTSALRDTVVGSWFIQEVTKQFKDHGESKSWNEIKTKVNNSISKKSGKLENGGIAKMMSDGGLDSLTKELYFRPGRPFPVS